MTLSYQAASPFENIEKPYYTPKTRKITGPMAGTYSLSKKTHYKQ